MLRLHVCIVIKVDLRHPSSGEVRAPQRLGAQNKEDETNARRHTIESNLARRVRLILNGKLAVLYSDKR